VSQETNGNGTVDASNIVSDAITVLPPAILVPKPLIPSVHTNSKPRIHRVENKIQRLTRPDMKEILGYLVSGLGERMLYFL
jgi:hypothetical protein